MPTDTIRSSDFWHLSKAAQAEIVARWLENELSFLEEADRVRKIYLPVSAPTGEASRG